MNTEFITKSQAFQRVTSNKHTTTAGIVIAVAFCLPQLVYPLCHVWAPGHVQQVKDSLDIISKWAEQAAVVYGFVMSGATKQQTNNDSSIQNEKSN